ncbi:MAG: glycosyltransferase [Acidobacteria bacterium]|nr:MAG: glycosyltransferase [Acidobacteriota bacterium]
MSLKPRARRAPKGVLHSHQATRSVPAVAIFARAVAPGKAKTRLIPALGPGGAARFHGALVSDVLAKVAGLKGRAARYLFAAGGDLPEGMVPRAFERRRQRGRGLGQRLSQAFHELLRGHSRAVIIGTDSPTLAPAMLRLALEELRATDAVLGPCPDGGYYLIGLRRTVPGLFNGLRLGTEFAFGDTISSLVAHGLSCSVLGPCPDIDRPQDLAALKKFLRKNSAARRLAPCTWQFLSKW